MKFRVDTIVVYIIVILTLYLCFKCERNDLKCRDREGKECGENMGRAYANYKPEKDDDIETLLNKAKFTMRYETNSIFWRRSFVAAIVSAFLVLFMVKNKVPSGIQLLSAFLVIYVVLYLTFTMFQRWVSKPAINQMDNILNQINRQL